MHNCIDTFNAQCVENSTKYAIKWRTITLRDKIVKTICQPFKKQLQTQQQQEKPHHKNNKTNKN